MIISLTKAEAEFALASYLNSTYGFPLAGVLHADFIFTESGVEVVQYGDRKRQAEDTNQFLMKEAIKNANPLG